ncbi:MAG: xanthine dehydrogenase family protein subunit M [Alphaproteobacteria bacterium]
MLAEFDLTIPKTLPEALESLANGAGGAPVPLAGGTNLLVDLRARHTTPPRLLGLGNIGELRGIALKDGKVVTGGATTVSDILRHPKMAEWAPSLVASARVFGGQMVRNAATLVGNVCYGSPAADLVPPLLSLDADLVLTSRNARRIVPLDDFFLGYKEDRRRPDELMTQITWKPPAANSANVFYKLGRRKGDAITVAGLAVSLTVERGKCTGARIVLGAVAPIVKRAKAAEGMLIGAALSGAEIDAAARQAADESGPIDDVRASAEYRHHAVHVLVRRLLTDCRDRLA